MFFAKAVVKKKRRERGEALPYMLFCCDYFIHLFMRFFIDRGLSIVKGGRMSWRW